MQEIAGKVADFLVSQGLSGIVILVSFYAIYRLFNLLQDAMNKRIDEAVKSIIVHRDITEALEKLTEYIRDTRSGPK